jgi:hypothetical protein
MVGYDGYSKSNNAVDAENKGRYPISRARVIVARETGVTQREAERVLRALPGSGDEYHHTSKRYNLTWYFDAEMATEIIRYAIRTDAPIDAVIEMVKENDPDILTARTLNHEEEAELDRRHAEEMTEYRAECLEAERREVEKKEVDEARKVACSHSNAKIVYETKKGGISVPAYRKCAECHSNYLPLTIKASPTSGPTLSEKIATAEDYREAF